MLVVIQAVLPVRGDVEVFPAVVVVIAHADALTPARGGQTGLDGYITEGSIVVVAVKMVGRSFAFGESFESCSVNEEDVRPSVVVVIEDGHARAGRLDNVFFGCESAENVSKRQSRFFGDVDEIDFGLRSW